MRAEADKFTIGLKALNAWLVIAFAACLPLSLTLSWAVLIAGLVATLLEIGRGTIGGGALPVRANMAAPLALPLLAFACSVTISGIYAGGVFEGLASAFSLRALIVYFWAGYAFAADGDLRRQSSTILLCVSAVAGIWGAIQQISDFHPFGYHYLQGTGFFGGPMAFAGLLQLTSLLSLALYLGGGYRQMPGILAKSPAFALIVAANVLGVVFAAERSAWLGFAAGVLALCAVMSLRTFVKAAAALACLSAAAWYTVPVVQKRLLPVLDWHNDVSIRVRLFLWKQAALLFKKSPLLGVGIRRFPHFDIPEAIVPGRSVDINHAHNNYLQILCTTGALGLICYLWLWFSALKLSLAQSRVGDPFQRSLGLGIFAGVVALMVAGLFEYNFGTAQVRLAHWFILGMLAGAGACCQASTQSQASKPLSLSNSASGGEAK